MKRRLWSLGFNLKKSCWLNNYTWGSMRYQIQGSGEKSLRKSNLDSIAFKQSQCSLHDFYDDRTRR